MLGKGKKVGQLESGSQKDGLIEVNACAPLRRSFGQQAISPNSVDRLAGHEQGKNIQLWVTLAFYLNESFIHSGRK